MQALVIKDAEVTDYPQICDLNEQHVQHTSAMDLSRLAQLAAWSCYFKVACTRTTVRAFLLAMDDRSAYPNENFAWFKQRYASFVYVDRIVVSSQTHGLKLGSRLYEDLIAYARTRAIRAVTCEYNIVPTNEPSQRFHGKFGFTEQGTQWLDEGKKCVSLQVLTL